ncbi:hypothetical protein [Rhodococcus sp. NPDC049939]|uniref:hypothetical protein n=1 Tax=Rhodococcus sp. NPDC049939 TaxID=3155511 RepID=UPI0033DF0816
MSVTRRRISLFIAVPTTALAIAGLTVGATGVAAVNSDSAYQAQAQTVSMPVSNEIDMAGVIAGLSDPAGQWVTESSAYIASPASETVPASALDSNGLEATVNPYVVPVKHGYGGGHFKGGHFRGGHFKGGHFKNGYGDHFRFGRGFGGGFFGGY